MTMDSHNNDDNNSDIESSMTTTTSTGRVERSRKVNSAHEDEEGTSDSADVLPATAIDNDGDAPTTPMIMSSTPSLKKVLDMARPEWTMIGVALLLMLVSEATNLLLPLIVANAYDALVAEDTSSNGSNSSNNSMADINFYMAMTLIIYAVGALAGLSRSAILGVTGERLVARLRLKLYQSILRQEIAFFDEHKSGELVSRLGSDTTLLQNVIAMSIPEAMVGMIKVVVSIALMFYISPKLAGVSIGGTFLLCAMATPFGFLLAKLSKEYQDVLGDAQTHSTEAFGNMRTVQAFAAEDKEVERYGKKIGNPDDFKWWWPSKEAGRTTYRVGVFKSLNTASFFSLVFGGGFGFLYVSLWYGFYLVNDGEMSLGDLTAFQSYIFTIGFGLGQTAGHLAQIFAGLGASGRVFYLIQRVPQIPKSTTVNQDKDPGNTVIKGGDDGAAVDDSIEAPNHNIPQASLVPTSMEGDIQFDNVIFAYPSRPDVLVLNGFTLRLAKNTTTALVGSSGAGKSTIVSLIQRFYDIDGGRITIDGNNLESLDLKFLRKHIGYVQQEPQLFGLTVRQNLLYGIDDESSISQEALEQVCRDANAHEFISSWSTGYDTIVGEKGVKLSGGQKQRYVFSSTVNVAQRCFSLCVE